MFGMSEEATRGVNNTFMLSIRPIRVWKLPFTWFAGKQGVFGCEQFEKLFSCSVDTEKSCTPVEKFITCICRLRRPFANIEIGRKHLASNDPMPISLSGD